MLQLTCVHELKTTASDSALVAIVAARSLYTSRHPDVKLEDLVIYTTTQTHSLGTKAALVLGLNTRALEVSADDGMRLCGATLETALKEDAEAGLHPFVLSSWYRSCSGPGPNPPYNFSRDSWFDFVGGH